MIDNSLLILGPPGCGKTYRLIQEIKSALDSGVHPSRIGVISFTRKAIEEMVSRACAEFNLTPKDFPYMRTSHSFGFNGLGLQRMLLLDRILVLTLKEMTRQASMMAFNYLPSEDLDHSIYS
jgi:superfamily I DNA/RNA helicase